MSPTTRGGVAPPAYADLKAMSDEELVAWYDGKATAGRIVVGLDFVRQELALREHEKQNRTLVLLTWTILALTAVVTIATLVNVWSIWQAP